MKFWSWAETIQNFIKIANPKANQNEPIILLIV